MRVCLLVKTNEDINDKPSAKADASNRNTFSDFFKSMKSKIVDLNEEVVKSEPKKKLTPKMPKFGFDPAADPVFGLRMFNPLLSSQAINEKMAGKTPVPVNRVSTYLKSADNSDWVVAGVLVNKSFTKTTQKGMFLINFILFYYFTNITRF